MRFFINLKKPVMLVRANFKADADIECDIMNHIMFPTDFSEKCIKGVWSSQVTGSLSWD